jgi:hypothetical protein
MNLNPEVTEGVMTRDRLIKMLGSLSLLGPLAVAAWADDKATQSDVRIYNSEDVIEQATIQQTAPEQSRPATTESMDAAPANGAANGCNGEAEETPGYLMQHLSCGPLGSFLECNGIKVAGWLAQGFTWNPDSPSNRFNFPMTFNDRSNEYQLNQFYLYAEKAANTEGCCWDFGGRIDVLVGSDYYFTTSTGWETNPDGSQDWNSEDGPRFQFGSAKLFGIAAPQMYAQVYAPIGTGWDIKLGHFYTPMGYETVTSTGNFFYSHAFTHQYFEPFTHWGVYGTTPISDSVKLGLGATAGWDTLDDSSDKLSAMGTVTWTSCDQNTSVFYGITIGEEPGILKENGRIYQSLYVTRKMCNLLSVTGTDLLWQNDGSFSNSGAVDDAECYSVYQYLIYEINKCLSAGIRGEIAQDDDNLRIVPIGAGPAALGLPGPFAEESTYTSLTVGLNWKPFENVRVRPELRWDWTDFNLGPLSSFDDASDNNQFTASFDVILTF